MKVLMITLDKSIFGPNSASLERLKEYSGFCEKLSVVVLTQKRFEPIIFGNLSVFATGSSGKILYAFDALELVKKVMKGEKHDVVSTQDPFDTGHIGWLVKRKYKIPWQCQIHGDIFSPSFRRESLANELRVWAAKFLLPRADGIRAVSERIKCSLKDKKIKLKREALVLPIFVDVEKLALAEVSTDLKQKYPPFDFLALAASRLSREKNLDLLLRSMAEVVKKYPKTGLIIVGEGKDKERLKKLAGNLGLEQNVIFEPWSNDLASYYKTADLFLLTSNYEGWGMSVVEAAACSCPIVMTDVGCAGELIKSGENGLIIRVGDKGALVSAMERMMLNPELRKSLGKAAQKTALSLPGRQHYLDLYRKSLADALEIKQK